MAVQSGVIQFNYKYDTHAFLGRLLRIITIQPFTSDTPEPLNGFVTPRQPLLLGPDSDFHFIQSIQPRRPPPDLIAPLLTPNSQHLSENQMVSNTLHREVAGFLNSINYPDVEKCPVTGKHSERVILSLIDNVPKIESYTPEKLCMNSLFVNGLPIELIIGQKHELMVEHRSDEVPQTLVMKPLSLNFVARPDLVSQDYKNRKIVELKWSGLKKGSDKSWNPRLYNIFLQLMVSFIASNITYPIDATDPKILLVTAEPFEIWSLQLKEEQIERFIASMWCLKMAQRMLEISEEQEDVSFQVDLVDRRLKIKPIDVWHCGLIALRRLFEELTFEPYSKNSPNS